MTSFLFNTYAKAYEVALFGHETKNRPHHEVRDSNRGTTTNVGGLRHTAGRMLRGLARARRA